MNIKQAEIREQYDGVVSISNGSVKNSWAILLDDGTRIVRHYSSAVITFKPNGDIVLYNAGYSPTTRKLVNRELPNNISVYQKKYCQYVSVNGHERTLENPTTIQKGAY
jgi:hypothetical protein